MLWWNGEREVGYSTDSHIPLRPMGQSYEVLDVQPNPAQNFSQRIFTVRFRADGRFRETLVLLALKIRYIYN